MSNTSGHETILDGTFNHRDKFDLKTPNKIFSCKVRIFFQDTFKDTGGGGGRSFSYFQHALAEVDKELKESWNFFRLKVPRLRSPGRRSGHRQRPPPDGDALSGRRHSNQLSVAASLAKEHIGPSVKKKNASKKVKTTKLRLVELLKFAFGSFHFDFSGLLTHFFA